MKFGLTDAIANLRFADFLYSHSQNSPLHEDSHHNDSLLSHPNHFTFSIPCLTHSNIANIKMKDLVHFFRSEMLVFDLEKKSGIAFNLPDILQCGMIGISGVASNYKQLWKIIDNSLNLFKSQIFTKDYKPFLQDYRTDLIDLNDIFGRAKMIYKNLMKEK